MVTSAKVLISHNADQCLEQMVKTVNEGFDSGRVKKAELASWVLIQFASKLLPREIERIRADHFDQIAHLKGIVRKLEAAKNGVPEDFEALLNQLKAPSLKTARKQSPTNDEPVMKSDVDDER